MSNECYGAEAETVSRRAGGAVAWVELGTHPDASPGPGASGFALRRIERVVRSDDRVCPVGSASVAVQFGQVASVVALEVLGDRLARAIGPNLPFDRAGTGLTVAVGLATPGARDTDDRVARRARSAARSATRAIGSVDRTRRSARTAVTVDEPAAMPHPVARADGTAVAIRRRAVHRYGVGCIDGIPSLVPDDGRPDRSHPAEAPPTSNSCVLVVDPMAAEHGGPGFAAMTAVSVAERLGCRAAATVASPDDPLVMTVDGIDVDLVVLVLDGAWVGRSASWATGTWGLPARLTTAYADKGTPVLAVAGGAGAGALASCVAQGALALFSLDRLADALRSLDGFPMEEARQVAELGFPSRFRSLLELTAGERRVLFYLTEGWAAQDIAEELVVSLTTVRSHIRSVLRKLEVRSQLAAVAIANSRDLDQYQVTAHS